MIKVKLTIFGQGEERADDTAIIYLSKMGQQFSCIQRAETDIIKSIIRRMNLIRVLYEGYHRNPPDDALAFLLEPQPDNGKGLSDWVDQLQNLLADLADIRALKSAKPNNA